MMKRFIFLTLPLLMRVAVCTAQVNVVLLHQLIGESESEHARQDEARSRQVLVTAAEDGNRTGISRLQSMSRKLSGRFGALNMALDAVQVGIQATPIIQEIVQLQGIILRQAGSDVLLLALAYGTEADLVNKAGQLSNYLYGLLLSAGDLGQVKASDRRLLFAHVIAQLRSMAGVSKGLVLTMQYASWRKLLTAANPFSTYINTDKQLTDDILRNAAVIKYY